MTGSITNPKKHPHETLANTGGCGSGRNRHLPKCLPWSLFAPENGVSGALFILLSPWEMVDFQRFAGHQPLKSHFSKEELHMNHLKCVFSAVLAGTMPAGMMVFGTSAAGFPDADKIERTEAVNTPTALNVLTGKDGGTFYPNGFIPWRYELDEDTAICSTKFSGKEADGVLSFTSSYDGDKDEYTYSLGKSTFATSGNYTDLFQQIVRTFLLFPV